MSRISIEFVVQNRDSLESVHRHLTDHPASAFSTPTQKISDVEGCKKIVENLSVVKQWMEESLEFPHILHLINKHCDRTTDTLSNKQYQATNGDCIIEMMIVMIGYLVDTAI